MTTVPGLRAAAEDLLTSLESMQYSMHRNDDLVWAILLGHSGSAGALRAALAAAPERALDSETLSHMLDHHYDVGHTTDEDGVSEDFLECAEEMLNWLEAASEDAAEGESA